MSLKKEKEAQFAPMVGKDYDDASGSSDSSSSGSSKSLNADRGNWGGRLDFLLTCIGYAVGLGNIWRFPYLCYRSGGGAFFIPYIIFLVLCGFPLFFLEISYGQFASLSPISVWKMCPMFKGIGVGMVIISGIVCVYYNVIVAWTLYYLVMSMRSQLPWATCGNYWNTEDCFTDRSILSTNETFGGNGSGILSMFGNATGLVVNMTYNLLNDTSAADIPLSRNMTGLVSASEEFWERHVLELTSGIEDLGSMRWPLVGTLMFAWGFVFLCLFKGVEILGKVMHVLAPFPYLVLLILLVRGVTLEGAMDGILFYIVPRWEKLTEFKVWGDAAVQIFYSVGMAWGGLITMASYNKFHNNVHRDAIIVPIMNCGTSIFAGFVIFSILGHMAHTANVDVGEVVKEGPGLTFIAYPEVVAKLPISPLWAVLFFFMLFVIGVDSQFGMFETMLSALSDEYPQYLRSRKTIVCAIACVVELLLGLPCVTQGGAYVLTVIDWYCASFSLMILSLAECVVIAWVYGVDRFSKDIALMIGFEPHFIWRMSWKYITPITILCVWVFSVSQLKPVTYGDYEYPQWAIVFGWFLGVCALIPIPTLMVWQIIHAEGTLMERIKSLLRPHEEWGPALPHNREMYLLSLEEDKIGKKGVALSISQELLKHPSLPEKEVLLNDKLSTV